VLNLSYTSLLLFFSVVVTDLISLEPPCIYIIYTLETPLGFLDAWGRTINSWCVVVLVAWCDCHGIHNPDVVVIDHGNLVWLLW
jgi:hypothetical protein